MNDAVKEIIITALEIAIPLIFSYIGIACKKIYNKVANNEIKQVLAKNAVMFVEQTCKDLHGQETFAKAKVQLVELLNAQKIKVDIVEIDTLIESAVGEFNKAFKSE